MKILFIGTHGQNNLGDELLLQVFVHKLGRNVKEWYINSYKPESTKKLLRKKNVHTFHTRRNPLKLLNYLYKCDAVIFGGGSIIKELYSDYGGKPYGTLNLLVVMTFVAKRLFQKPVILSNIGVGPLDTEKGKKLAHKIIANVDYISVRDSISGEYLDSLDAGLLYKKLPDASFSIDKRFLGLTKKTKRTKKNKIKIGLNLCRNIGNNSNWDFFIGTLSKNIIKLCKTNQAIEIIGLPMQMKSQFSNDYLTLKEFRQKLKEKLPTIVFKIRTPSTVKGMVSAIEECDLIVSERLHCLIIAAILKKPFLALEYDPKVSGFVKDLGFSEFGININSSFPSTIFTRRLNYLILHGSKVSQKLSLQVNSHNRQAKKGFEELKSYLIKVSQPK